MAHRLPGDTVRRGKGVGGSGDFPPSSGASPVGPGGSASVAAASTSFRMPAMGHCSVDAYCLGTDALHQLGQRPRARSEVSAGGPGSNPVHRAH